MDELKNDGHYLPHRAVIKENSTTKIRPVFDASSCEKGKPSLNSCLEVGPNLIESIPSILLRFRMFKFGIISDIRKAFLQISLNPKVRDFLRFLWIGENGEDIIFRHRRVVFGVKSSPFLLGATIEHHLNECKKKCMNLDKPPYRLGTINKLSESFYVDNCVTSVEEEHYVNRFIQEAKVIMNEGCFDLRGWEYTRYETQESKPFPVLGLSWYTSSDVLSICDGCILEMPDKDLITKRKILSISQKVFDPIGFTCPASLYPKLILQKTWEDKLGWDDPVQPEYSRDFIKWVKNVHLLLTIKIPRCINWGSESSRSYSLHMFCDASKEAYAAVVYLRVKEENQVCIYLLAAKARVAPLKKMTIPRLELLAATIGARLFNSLKIQLDRKLDCFCWSDSSTVLCWIRRTEEWSVFIRNRIEEIRMLTSECTWRHIPGSLNPADLPSRGCTIKQLISSKWWEGPIWLYEEPELWLNDFVEYDEEEVNKERKKKSVPTLMKIDSIDWHLNYFSKYNKTLRMMAWIFRFKYNVENKPKLKGMLSIEEIQRAEIFILKTIQAEYFQDIHDKQICTLNPFYDEYGLIRLKSRISQREDIKDFCFPILLPAKNHVVSSLIFEVHVNACHVGIQALLSILRENYWILGGRKTIRSVLSKCSVCRRLNSKHFEVNPSILPLNRVNDAAVFEVTGVDFAGPLILKNGDKAWICLFTCAVYRAIHLELSTSVSTPAFLQVLRRFIARRGRPKIIYSDNGTNFVGTENYFEKLDWDHINLFSSAQRIKWYFNPPTAAWWGGFWERLIGLLKQLLRKVLQRARLTFEELMTVICDCESVVNSRPLTYVSNDPSEFVPLTPNMFLRDVPEYGVPDCDAIEAGYLNRRIAYQQKLREALRARFRKEYLGQLKLLNSKVTSRIIHLNEIVLIGNDNKRRLDWPLGKVIELLPGKDGKIRLVRLQTANGQVLRPVQRLYPLESTEDNNLQDSAGGSTNYDSRETSQQQTEVDTSAEVKPRKRVTGNRSGQTTVTRSGRISKIPKRFM